MGASVRIAILADAARARAELRGVGDAAEDSGGRVKRGLGGLGEMVKGGLAGIGIAAGAALVAGIGEALEQSKLNAKLGAQLGLNQAETKQMGKLSGKIYADGFGEDVAQVNEAIKGVYQQIPGVTGPAMQEVASQVLSLANTFDQDLGGTTAAVGQLMKTGLAGDAKEALDILAVGFQSGADKAGDLLDTFTEYGTQFRKFGLDGQTAVGLMTQGLKAGARDADTVADAIKEFSIKALDGNKATQAGFASLGLSAKQMTADIAGGGPKAAAALDMTLDRLRAVEDPAKRSQLAVALFGTKAEDLGDALYSLDPSTAVAGLGEVAGAAQRVGDTMGDSAGAKVEKFKRMLTQGFVEGLGGLIGMFEGLGEKAGPAFSMLGEKVGPLVTDIGEKLLPKLKELWAVVESDVIPALMGWGEAIAPIYMWLAEKLFPIISTVFGAAVDIIRGALQIITGIIKVATSILTGDWRGAWEGIKSILSGAWTIIKTVVSTALSLVKAVFSAGIDAVVTVAKGIGSRIKSAVGSLGSLLVDAGRAVVSGLKNGIANAWGSFTGWISAQINKIPLAVRKVLGIASPSKVFRKIGQQTGQGLVLGLGDSETAVERAAAGLVSIPGVPTVGATGGAGAAGAAVSIGQVVVQGSFDLVSAAGRRAAAEALVVEIQAAMVRLEGSRR